MISEKKNTVGKKTTCVKGKIRNDIILVAVILTAVALMVLLSVLFKKDGDTAVVTVNGKLYGEYPLSRGLTERIISGDGYNLLVIENGKAYVKEASCPDGICVSHRAVKNDRECIICLPNKVVVEIVSRAEDAPDATA